ncbi:AraC-type DNA-binding protein [Pseudobutyrivibrio sp. YE44]|uniref:AraC family transcriptional regulator n=1 Tax=Pseudobutyrivibrio sp. YE44 TaxID=1520802 RepID=UPI00088C0992|nr:AraC family transcriptional regulator [Pseudobutyrivibrio sp. YE44]SDB37400.1 AraC-type DNA-binding protein [Pseudobutyrivibrio sp. YE44]
MTEYSKKGYLYSNFKIFHLSDSNLGEIDFHYHDFHKVLIHLSGNTSYSIEGQNFDLQANDIVFVNAGEVHRPIFHDNSTYERIIIYISKEFLAEYAKDENDLSYCFRNAMENNSHVLRLRSFKNSPVASAVNSLINNLGKDAYANELFMQVLFLEFMVQLNRAAISDEVEYISTSYSGTKINSIIQYINENLTDDLSVDNIAAKFYLSRYYLMHTFKDETGYTIGNYITMKRLSAAQTLIDAGTPIVDASEQVGFGTYSTFLRAYKKTYGTSPRKKAESQASLSF